MERMRRKAELCKSRLGKNQVLTARENRALRILKENMQHVGTNDDTEAIAVVMTMLQILEDEGQLDNKTIRVDDRVKVEKKGKTVMGTAFSILKKDDKIRVKLDDGEKKWEEFPTKEVSLV